MYRFYLAAVDMLPAMLVLIPTYWILDALFIRNPARCFFYCLFSCYLAVVYVLVGLPTVTYIHPELNVNLIPVLGMVSDFKNSILNICLFIPLGLALPIGWKRYQHQRYVIRFGFCISVGIELLQILTFRTTDVNDVITNTLGAYLGWQIAKIIMSKKMRITGFTAEGKAYELFAVLLIVLCLMFFLYPFISAALWDWLLA